MINKSEKIDTWLKLLNEYYWFLIKESYTTKDNIMNFKNYFL
jgi:hypothetical protein